MASPTSNLHPAVCPHDCTSTCALDVEILASDRIGRVRGARRNPYTDGVICEKVARYAERTHHPDRLLYPLLRTGAKGSGQFRRITWNEALDRVAEAFIQRADRFGSETIWPYFYAGTMGLVQRDGIQRLRHAMRYSRWHSTICVTLADTGWIAGVGEKRGVDLVEAAEYADLIVIWGGNPVHTQVNVMHHVMAAKKRGAMLIVVDPYRTATAQKADLHVAPRPGTDGALACALMHVLFREGFANQDYLAKYTDCPAELEAHVQTRTPEWAERITGIPAATIVDFARRYGRAQTSFIRAHHGFSRQRNGAVNMHAVVCLPSITGAWLKRGGGAIYGQTGLYPLDRTLIEGLDVMDPSLRALDQSRLGPILTGDGEALANGVPVTGLLVQNTNPAVVCPDLTRVRAGLARDDLFTCVHEQFMTETAKYADIVLPATTFLEHDDFYTASGHTTFQVSHKLVDAPGEARENHVVVCELAHRLGAEHPGFHMTVREIMDETLRLSGMMDSQANASAGGEDCRLDWNAMHFIDGFPTADRRFHFKADWQRFGGRWREMPVLPDHFNVNDPTTPDKPYRLVTAPARTFLNSTFTETPGSRNREGEPTLNIAPETCAALGISKGDQVVIGNDRGEVRLFAVPREGQLADVLVAEGLFPDDAYPGGTPINVLTSAEPGWPNGGAVFHDTAVWLRALSAG